ncbi:MAG: outer membrane beta-barrel protein [Bacteroidales bacterium]|nr:outer membrane beta-barrel protein [Bacteroidales bacterium]
MKRLFMLFILSVLSMNTFAQNDNGKLWISAQGGIMFSNVYSYRGLNYNREYDEHVLWAYESNPSQPIVVFAPGNRFKAGAKLGLGLRYCFNESYSLILNFNYEQKGARGNVNRYEVFNGDGYYGLLSQGHVDTPIAVYDIDADIYFDYYYLTIPLCFEWQYNNRFFFNAGAYLAYQVKDYTYTEFYLNDELVGYSYDIDKERELVDSHIDYGLEYGIGYNLISTSKNRLSLLLSGSLGLAPAEDTDLRGISVRGTKNHSFGLTLKYERKAL